MKRFNVICVLLLVSTAAFVCAAPAQQTVTGSWKCVGAVSEQKMEFQLDLVQKGAEVTGTATRPDGSAGIDKGSFVNGKLALTIGADSGEYLLQATFEGPKLKGPLTHSTGIKGTWEATRAGGDTQAASIAGNWKLTAVVNGNPQEHRLELKEEGSGYAGSLVTADGQAIPVGKISFVPPTLRFVVMSPDGDYNCEAKVEGKTMKGTFTVPSGARGDFTATKI